MKKLLLLPALLVCINCNNTRKADEAPAPQVTDTILTPVKESGKADTIKGEATLDEMTETPADPVAAIRKRVEYINTANLEKKHFEFMCDEKMTVDYFYDNGEIVKVAVDFGTVGDVYAREGYYYDNGKLIFNYEFVEGGAVCEGCTITTNEYRTYVQDNKSIRYLKDNNQESCRTCSFGPTSRQYKVLKAKTQEEVKSALCR